MISSVGSSAVFSVPLAQTRQAAGAAPQEAPAGQAVQESTESEGEDQRVLNALQAAAAGEDRESGSPLDNELTEEEEKVVEDLKQTDQEVRAHEQAHKTVGGAYAGAIQYETVTGPDGREYAIGGEVPIDASPIAGNPEATIRKLDIVIRAALAPAQPSSQDFAVARAAQAARAEAQKQLNEQREAEQAEARGENTNPNAVLSENGSTDPNALSPEQQEQLGALLQGLQRAQGLDSAARGSLFSADG
jgi:hypothetical protein